MKGNFTESKTAQEIEQQIANIETEGERAFAKLPEEAFKFLMEELEKEEKGAKNEAVKNKIKLLLKTFSNRLEAKENGASAPLQEAFLGLIGDKKIGEVKFENGEIEAIGAKNFQDPNQQIDGQTIIGVGSIGKQFTAATLLKLWDEEISEGEIKNFDEGIDTKLAKFMPALKEKYPACAEKFAEMEADPHFAEITLRDLLNHTHGLGKRDNEEVAALMKNKGEEALSFAEIINTNKAPNDDQYQKFHYGNLGYDLVGMIIETITGKDFEDVVKEKIIEANDLKNTYTTKDFPALYADAQKNIATGFAVDERVADDLTELKLNQRSFGTRAAGGIKSNVEDLAKFAPAFMNAEMFENDAVKAAVINRDPQNNYHLAIEKYPDQTLGHNGDDVIFKSHLRYNPQTGAVEAGLAVVETLTDHVAKKIFEQNNPKDALDSLKKDVFTKFDKSDSKNLLEALDEKLKEDPQARENLEKYSRIREEIGKTAPKEMIEKYGEIFAKKDAKEKSFADVIAGGDKKAKEAEDLNSGAKSWTKKAIRSKDTSVIKGGRT